mmetsp:Transcript_145284/g.253564  ORF Transcript_145284/g.253564 Transcript_145284/m.253564 type:complete len:320 (-) Transcript_145284:49-1008(-)
MECVTTPMLLSMSPSLLIALGGALTLYGLCSGIAWLVWNFPWVLMILIGCICSATGAILQIWQHGALQWLPASIIEVLLNQSVFSVLMTLRGMRSQVRDPANAKGQGKSQQWVRLLTLCMLELDDDFVREIIEGMDPSFRESVFRRGLIHFLPGVVQRLVLGGSDVSVKDSTEVLAEKTEGERGDLLPTQRRVTNLVDIVGLEQRVAEVKNDTPEHSARDPPNAAQGAQRAGILSLACRIVFYEVVQKPWRKFLKHIRDTRVYQKSEQLYERVSAIQMQIYTWANTSVWAGYICLLASTLDAIACCKRRNPVKPAHKCT